MRPAVRDALDELAALSQELKEPRIQELVSDIEDSMAGDDWADLVDSRLNVE